MKAGLALLAPLLWSCASAAAEPSKSASTHCPASLPLARLVAEADLIVAASPDVPAERLRSAMAVETPDYIDVTLRSATILKGEADAAGLVVRIYPQARAHAPSPESLLARARQPTLFFLVRVDKGPTGLYFASSPEALQSESPAQLAAVQTEVRRQQLLNSHWVADPSLPQYSRVRALLAGLPEATLGRQELIFRDLEALGSDAVPAIIAQLDDRTPLAHQQISLVNHFPGAFEALRHYGPVLVVDALDAILNQITGFGGSIVNGGSERQRRNAVEMWRVYAADMGCSRSEGR